MSSHDDYDEHDEQDELDEQPEQAANPVDVEQIILADGRYRPEAFNFLHEGLARAVQDAYGEPRGPGDHVTGQQLCMAIRDLAVERYGLMAAAVLRRWGVRGSIDFGNMVYLLIEHGVMRKTDEDSIEDFRDVFDLNRDFDMSDEIRLKQ